MVSVQALIDASACARHLPIRGWDVQKSARIRAIFAELRAAGVEAPARDLLRIANYILQTFGGEIPEDASLRDPSPDTRQFFTLPVDEAMKDGGWQILEFEARRQQTLEEMTPEARTTFINRIRKALGSEWQHQPRLD